MTTPTENENAAKRSVPPSSFPQYQPPQVEVADGKMTGTLYKLARMMMKRGKHGKKIGQTVHITHRKKARFY